MPKEPRLDMIPDGDIKISGEKFRKIVRRIESIVPIAGENIKVQAVDGGHKISTKSPKGAEGFVAQEYDKLFTTIPLSVCINGEAGIIYVSTLNL